MTVETYIVCAAGMTGLIAIIWILTFIAQYLQRIAIALEDGDQGIVQRAYDAAMVRVPMLLRTMGKK